MSGTGSGMSGLDYYRAALTKGTAHTGKDAA